MRLENYSVAAFEDVGVIDDEPTAAAAPPAVEPTPAPEAPSTLLSEMAQQPPVLTLTPPPAPVRAEPTAVAASQPQPAAETSAADARIKPLSSAAEVAAEPAWQGMSLPGTTALPAGATPSPWPGIDAATFARIEAMGSHDSGGGRGFGGFGGGGFGGVGGGDEAETWDYTYSGVDGAPDVTVSVTYQGETPISSTTTTTLGSNGDVGGIGPEIITPPAGVDLAGLSSEVPALPDLVTGTHSTAAAPVAADTGPAGATISASNGSTSGSPVGGQTAGSPAAQDGSSSTPANPAPPSQVVGQNAAGQDIRAVGSYQQQGALRVVNDAPSLPAGHPDIVSDATGATPMRDDSGTLLYRIDGGRDDGAIRQLVPAGTQVGPAESLPVEHLDTVVVTGRRDPNAGASDLPGDAASAQSHEVVAPGDAGAMADAARSAGVAARLATLARAGLVAEMELGPPQLKALAAGSLALGAALAARRAARDMLTPEEQRDAGAPLINVPPPPAPPLPGFTPEPRDPSDNVLANPGSDARPPLIETLPIHEQDPEASILTKDGNADNNRDRARASYGRNPGLADPSTLEGQSAIPGQPPEQVGQWAYPPQPRGPKDPNIVPKGQEFQEAGTGVPGGLEINLGGTPRTTPNGSPTAEGGVWLDGLRVETDGQVVYIDRKDWSDWPPTDRPELAERGIGKEANRQLANLPEGAKLEWQFSDPQKAGEVANMLSAEQRKRIIITVVGGP